MSKRAVMKWQTVGPVMISCSGEGKMDDALWKPFAKDLETKSITKFLQGVVGSVEVSSLQRKLVVDILRAHKISSVVVTDDSFVRGMITAASWLGADIKGYAWAELPKAIEQLESSPELRERMLLTMESLRLACR